MNGGFPPPSHSEEASAPLADALDSAWFGVGAAPGSVEQATGLPERAEHGWLSWLFRGGREVAPTNVRGKNGGASDRRTPRRQQKQVAQRARANGGEGAPPRLPRSASVPKMPQQASTSSYAALPPRAAPKQQPAVTAGPKAGETVGAPQAAEATIPVPVAKRSSGGNKASIKAAAKQANYAERRAAWRHRIEAIKAKQASRADGPPGMAPSASSGALGGRVYSKHVAIPVSAGPGSTHRAGSTQSTPHGSPSRREVLSDAAGTALPQLEAPPIWHGFQTADAPPEMGAASDEQLRRFLQQAGWAVEAVAGFTDHEGLAAAARLSRGQWEVERIMACTWPEEVLRVPRKCSDAAVLKTAYRRCSMSVHPDKCSAVGASDAMSILTDCYHVLQAAASGGRAAVAVPAFMRQGYPGRAMHTSGSGANLASQAPGTTAGTAGTAGVPASAAAYGSGWVPGGQPEARRHSDNHTATGPGPEQQQQAQQQQQQQQVPHSSGTFHARHASMESFFTDELAAPDVWPESQEQGQQQEGPSPGRPPARSSSSGFEAPLGHTGGTGSSQEQCYWNPHGHFSSEEREAAFAGTGAGDVPAAAPGPSPDGSSDPGQRSRSSSASSFCVGAAGAATAAALSALPGHSPSFSSLASSAGAAGTPLRDACEGEGLARNSSSSSLASVRTLPPSPQPFGSSADSPAEEATAQDTPVPASAATASLAARASVAGMLSGRKSPQQQQQQQQQTGVAGATSRPGSAAGTASRPGSVAGNASRPGSAGGTASRAGSSMGTAPAAGAARSKPALAGASGKIRVTLKVRPRQPSAR